MVSFMHFELLRLFLCHCCIRKYIQPLSWLIMHVVLSVFLCSVTEHNMTIACSCSFTSDIRSELRINLRNTRQMVVYTIMVMCSWFLFWSNFRANALHESTSRLVFTSKACLSCPNAELNCYGLLGFTVYAECKWPFTPHYVFVRRIRWTAPYLQGTLSLSLSWTKSLISLKKVALLLYLYLQLPKSRKEVHTSPVSHQVISSMWSPH